MPFPRPLGCSVQSSPSQGALRRPRGQVPGKGCCLLSLLEAKWTFCFIAAPGDWTQTCHDLVTPGQDLPLGPILGAPPPQAATAWLAGHRFLRGVTGHALNLVMSSPSDSIRVQIQISGPVPTRARGGSPIHEAL